MLIWKSTLPEMTITKKKKKTQEQIPMLFAGVCFLALHLAYQECTGHF